MDFETVNQKFKNREDLTSDEQAFLIAEYRKIAADARRRCLCALALSKKVKQ